MPSIREMLQNMLMGSGKPPEQGSTISNNPEEVRNSTFNKLFHMQQNMGGEGVMQDTPAAPSIAGMVLNPKNALKLKDLIAGYMAKGGLTEGEAFVKAKYPSYY